MFFRKGLAVVLLAAVFIGAAAAKDNLAVLPFTGGVGSEGETVAELFSFSDELNAEFVIIPRTSIARAIGNEQSFQTSTGMTDPDTIAALGRQLGANYVVAGKIASLGNSNLLIISIMKIDELRQIAGDVQAYIRIEEIIGKLPSMVRNIIDATRETARTNSARLEKLAVVPVSIRDRNVDPQVADTLAQILSINFIRTKKYAVYPRTATLEQVQGEYNTQLSGAVADEHIVDIGKAENPRLVLSVVARNLGTLNMFNASIINLESGGQLIGRSVNYESLDDGIEVMGRLTQDLTGVSLAASGNSANARTTANTPSAGGTAPSSRDLDRARAEAEAAAAAKSAADAKAKADADARAKAAAKAKADADAKAKAKASPKPRRGRQSGGAAFGYGVLNLALGFGSLIQGDAGGWFTTLLFYGASAGLIYWELSLDYDDDLAGIPGAAGIGAAGLAVLYGFIRPAVFNNNRSLAEIIDRIDIAVIPKKDGREAVQLTYTAKF